MRLRGEGAQIIPYRDGPLVVRGSFVLLDEDGREIDPGRRTVALCRCGRSRLRPFCDGSHRRARYRAEGGVSPEAERRHSVLPDPLSEDERHP